MSGRRAAENTNTTPNDAALGLTQELAEALRLTQEYVGSGVLPPRPGWSWFDALDAYYRSTGTPGGYWEIRAAHYELLWRGARTQLDADAALGLRRQDNPTP